MKKSSAFEDCNKLYYSAIMEKVEFVTFVNDKGEIPDLSHDSFRVFSLEQKHAPPNYCMENKSIIFLVDVSTSMYYTLEKVKKSILTFRDLMCKRKGDATLSKQNFDVFMKNFSLATFSETVKWIWTPKIAKTNDFDTVIKAIEPEGSTNMGDAIELAFDACKTENKATWIVVLTDGESNRGSYQTKKAFANLSRQTPKNAKLITLGYGNEFNVEILNSLGNFTYLENDEAMITFMGSLYHEISTCRVFNAKIDSKDLTKIFGNENIGALFNERKFTICYKPDFTENPKSLVEVQVNYIEISELGLVYSTESFKNNGVVLDKPWDEIKRSYYEYTAADMIEKMYLAKNNSDNLKKTTREIKKKLTGWTDVQANSSRETVLRIMENLQKKRNLSVCESAKIKNISNSMFNQVSYTDDTYASPSALIAVSNAREFNFNYGK